MSRIFERIVKVYPAWDRRGEKGGYGQHCAEMHFIVRCHRKEMGLSVYTGWYADLVTLPYPQNKESIGMAHGASLYAHSAAFIKGGSKRQEYCEVFKSKQCYEIVLTSLTDDLLKILILEGSDKLFDELEKRFIKFFRKERGSVLCTVQMVRDDA